MNILKIKRMDFSTIRETLVTLYKNYNANNSNNITKQLILDSLRIHNLYSDIIPNQYYLEINYR